MNSAPVSRSISRRKFVKLATMAAVPFPGILVKAAESLSRGVDTTSDRILVMVQLSGGNDGLNMIIPFEDSHYHSARPSLAIEKRQALRLEKDSLMGFHPQMERLHGLYLEGKVTLIQGVGYPNPNRSHFRAMEIWHTAKPQMQDTREGWLG